MAKTASNRRWLRRQRVDPYVKRARELGFRSRAVFKLQEIDKRYHLFKTGMTIVDLGAAPGGWSQYAVGRIHGDGQVIATDILFMEPLPGVNFLQGDFTEQSVLRQIVETLGDDAPDIVISDMAPNITGMASIDQPRAMYLAELALELAADILKADTLLVKLFQGEGHDQFVAQARNSYRKVRLIKPDASRKHSREHYLLGGCRI
ncbi:MAG: 23S rRNA methyltransferase [Gammaproteobacteria bacterium]|nr:23S rRNA methyltransferase [Gammaproteobacteria bacterium]